jgi:hypothetical protein
VSALSQALIGNRGLVEGLIGFEPVERAVRLLLLDRLNAQIDSQAERWAQADLEMQALGFDEGVGQVDVEHVDASNIHGGRHESLLHAPPDKLPAVAVQAYQTNPSPTDRFGDQLDSSVLVIRVEIFVKAGPVPEDRSTWPSFETITNRRIMRTTEAVNAVLRGDPALLGSTDGVDSPPRGGIAPQRWVDGKSGDPRYMWQGSALQYTAQRPSIYS